PLRSAAAAVTKRQMAQTPLRALPTEILNRPKTGFSIPVGQWLADADNMQTGQTVAPGLRPWAQRVWIRWLESVPRFVA
ncbi:MAG: asparagine synthase-related protein, partial [Burkholderiaceae bacterium]